MMQKILLFEINEVPFRVIDYYCDKRPTSTLARILTRSRQYETVTEDSLALDPWISWPTMHRGVPDNKHQILHLGQVLDEVDAQYPPIWRLLKQAGVSVGVFGSLHSSTVPDDAAEYSFYVTDCFDNRVFAHPKALEPFQEFNLRMTRDSARNVSRKLPLGAAAKFALSAPVLGLTAGTTASIAGHLVKETLNKDLRIRRRNYQPLLSADLFMKQVRKTRPQFATFYSNNVAAAMHRYWGAAFPQDFANGTLDAQWVARYGGEVVAAMDAFDQMLEKMVSFVDANPDYTLVVASSMGQAAIPAQHTYEFLTIVDLGRSAPAWVLQAVLYCLSLSSLLLGLSAAHGDADEFPILFTQPVGRAPWLAGKTAALAALIGPASVLAIAPAALASGWTPGLGFVGAAAAAVCLVMALLGLAVGCWVRDHVRGLLIALGVWFVLLFGVDLALLALSGSPFVQQHADAWAAPLMVNPLSALRVTMLFTVERTAPASIGAGPLVGWWLEHGGVWLTVILGAWATAMFGLGVAGARRRLDL